MQVKDKQYLLNIFSRMDKSVATVNEKIAAHRAGKIPAGDVATAAALEQLAMQHEILLLLSMMIFDPGTSGETLPELPKKIIGF